MLRAPSLQNSRCLRGRAIESNESRRYVGIDPGLVKCGYAVVSPRGERLSIEIVAADKLVARVAIDVQAGVAAVCVGNATRSDHIVEMLRQEWPALPITLVDERNTSLEARRRYYEDHPPRGLLRFIPRGLLVPKAQLDGYAALLIIERYLGGRTDRPKG
jgi:RNase H-fold protein (predicted Holliday junction resolvase)